MKDVVFEHRSGLITYEDMQFTAKRLALSLKMRRPG